MDVIYNFFSLFYVGVYSTFMADYSDAMFLQTMICLISRMSGSFPDT